MAGTRLTFTLEGRDRLSRVLDKAGDSAGDLHKKLLLASAAIPAAAALAPLAAGAGAAAVAVAAFGAAIIPQIGALSDASEAQKKYEDAVAKSGATSEAAITAQAEFQQQIAKMPSASREAAAGLTTLKKEYRAWSDGLAKDTMPVFTKGLAVASAMLPKLTPLVKGASTELDRFMTTLAGGMMSPAVDGLSKKFADFATGSLRSANDGLVHLMRTLDTGKVGGALSEFMDYARAQGPLLAETLKNVATAALHLLQAASGVGGGVLQLANAAASLVASLPPGFITVLMQTAVAIRAVKLAGSGIQLLVGGFDAAATAIRGMGTAALGSATTMGSLRRAAGTLSTQAKLNIAAVGIGLFTVAMIQLSKVGKQAPPDVDKLTTSLGNLARTGKATGEAARVFGDDLSGLYDSVRNITDPSTADKAQQWMVKIGSLGISDSTPHNEAKERLDAIDKSLTSLARGGKADLAAVALKRLGAEYAKNGHSAGEFTSQMSSYKSALADAAFEQDLAAEAQGLFGKQAQKAQEALAAQKLSADGLRQSIQALNDAQRQGIGGMIGFEASIDAAAKAAKENHGALHMINGELDLNSPKAQAAATALNDLAAKTDEAAAQTRQSTGSWEAANRVYARGREKLIESARAMGLTKSEAKALADQILRTPDKTARLKGNIDDLEAKVTAAKKKLGSVPASRKASVKGDISNLLYEVSRAQRRLNEIDGKTAVTYIVMQTKTSNAGTVFHEGGNYASGGPVGFPGGGPISGPGSGTSDSIPIMASNGEYMINARSTAKYRSLIEAINADRLGGGRGMPGAGAAVAQGLMSGMAGSTSGVGAAARAMAAAVVTGIKAELEIASPSKKTKALAKDVGKGFIDGLTGSRDKIKSVSKDLANDVRTAFSGRKESGLLKMIDRQTKKLLDQAKKRDALAAKIAEAKKYASDVTHAARESAGLSNLGMEPDQVTAGGIKGGLASKLAQIKQFTKYVDMLAKRGLNKNLLRQILNMGPEQGYAYASALAGADKNTFKSINSMQGQLDKSTTKLGKLGADRLYDSGKNAGKGFLKGLEGQQKDIEKLMMSIAKGMQEAIKKALGIKSPSTVMAELGRFSTKGLAHGLVDAVPHLDRALGVVAGRVAGTRPVLGRPAAPGAGGGGMVVNVHIEQAMDPVAVGREIQRVLVQFGRAQGATVRLNVGG
jgi:chorismate mutase